MMQAIKKLYNFVQQNLFCKIVTYFLVFAPIVICMEKGTSVKKVNNPVPVSLLSGDRKPQIRFLGNHPSGSGNLYHKSFRM